MYNTNITSARTNLYTLVDMAIHGGEVINIATKKGNAMLINAEDYESLTETLFLSINPEIKRSIIDGINTPISECVPAEQIGW